MTSPIVRQALYLEVADRLRGMIHARALRNGEWIDELRLAGELGISRTPLREALKVLATEGLVRLSRAAAASSMSCRRRTWKTSSP